MTRILFIMLIGFGLNLQALNLPDCSDRSFDQGRRVVVMKNLKPSSAMQVIRILSTLEHERFVADALFPLFQDDKMTIHVGFSRYYEPGVKSLIEKALKSIAAIEGAQILCVPYQPGET